MNKLVRNALHFLFIIDDEDDDSTDEEYHQRRRPRLIRCRINFFDLFDDIAFIMRFRILKKDFIMLLSRIESQIQHQTTRNNAVPPLIQLLVALRFFATGCYFITVGDFIGVSKMTAMRIVHRVSEAVAELSAEFIKFPNQPDQIRQTQREFYESAAFIGVVGCLDCVHIRVQSFGGNDAELFRSRKGFFSINVQVTVNARAEITDIVARWPGASHDSTIFYNSRLKARFENNEFGNAILLGDRGYPNLPYLFTPLHNPRTPAEQLYNESHVRTRCVVERCFGMWTRMFAVLRNGSRFKTSSRVLPVIVGCAVLYNIYKKNIVHHTRIQPNAYDQIPQVQNGVRYIPRADERQRFIQDYFESLI